MLKYYVNIKVIFDLAVHVVVIKDTKLFKRPETVLCNRKIYETWY